MAADQSDDDYVYDEDSGEWMPAGELAARKQAAQEAADTQAMSEFPEFLPPIQLLEVHRWAVEHLEQWRRDELYLLPRMSY